MDTCSYFIVDKALFGCYPTNESIKLLENEGVRYFIDLTELDVEDIPRYTTEYNYMNYPIQDIRIPKDWPRFANFIMKLAKIIDNLEDGEKIYIHCRGGHGRSGIVVACLLCYIYNLKPEKALDWTNYYHEQRKNMKDKWRIMGAPQTRYQKSFVHRFFAPIYFTNESCNFLSTYSPHPVKTGLGTFHTAEAAFQAYKNPCNEEYIESQKLSKSGRLSKIMGKSTELRYEWESVKVDIMYNVLKSKYEQHDDIRKILIATGLRPIIKYSKVESFWSNSGHNILGKLLEKLREEFNST